MREWHDLLGLRTATASQFAAEMHMQAQAGRRAGRWAGARPQVPPLPFTLM